MDEVCQYIGVEPSGLSFNEISLNSEGKPINDRDEVEKLINDYLDELGPEVKAVAKINFSSKNVASTSVTYDNWTNKIRINVRLPVAYREGRYLGVLHHEIGSHFLRRFNEVQQPWHNEIALLPDDLPIHIDLYSSIWIELRILFIGSNVVLGVSPLPEVR